MIVVAEVVGKTPWLVSCSASLAFVEDFELDIVPDFEVDKRVE